MFAEKRRLYGFSRGTEIPWRRGVQRGIGRGPELVGQLISFSFVFLRLNSFGIWCKDRPVLMVRRYTKVSLTHEEGLVYEDFFKLLDSLSLHRLRF